MKTMKKIVAILAVAMLLCSVLPLSVFAADGDETITVTATTGVLDGTASISWDGTNYQVINYKDNSTNAIRTSDTDHFRIYVGNEFYVRGKNGALMSKVVINSVSSYLINNTSNTVSDGWTVTASGTTITYTATSGAASELHISIGKQSRVKSVVITPAAAAGAECDHNSLVCGDTCPECGEYTKEHVFANNCAATCSNCNEANPNHADHVYDGAYDASCNVCGNAREVSFPEADTELTILEADAIGSGMSHDTTTPNKYYVTGVVESIANTTYGNLYIEDEEGNKLYIYGCYNEDGSTRYDAMVEKPQVGMIITVYGVIGNYNGSQMKNGWVTYMESVCDHEYEFDCSKVCSLCGLELRPEAECSPVGDLCQDSECEYCGEIVAGIGHQYDDQWDADCNECGETREVEERPQITEATVTFDADKTQRTEYSTSAQKWENGGLVVLNEKAASTSNVGDYSNPGRFYKSSSVTISFPGMTSLVIDAGTVGGTKYSTPWGDMLTAAGLTYTNESEVYTVTFAVPVDSITLTCSAQVRVSAITATAVKQSEPACEHEYFSDCDSICLICGEETREAGHNIVHVEAVAPTCTAMGNIEFWYCDVCGMAWLDEACTLNTNMMAVKLPMAEHTYDDCEDLDCNVCGAAVEAAHHNLTYVPAVVPTTCLEEGYDEYWKCSDCKACFGDAEASYQINPAWMYYTGDCVRPEDAADCATVPCTVCGNDTYGEGAHDVLACQGGTCSKCGENIEGYGCANYDTPACEDGVCYYCGGFVAGYGHENGSWAACCDGECSYGCGLQYPATESHVDEDADDYCDNCWNHLNHDVDPCIGGECSVCWTYIEGAHSYDNAFDTDCNACGEIRAVVAPINACQNSISEEVSGLAFKFDVEIEGIAIEDGYYTKIDYTNATYGGYKLLSMGVTASNSKSSVQIEATHLYALEGNEASVAYRIINIPEANYDDVITMVPYFVVEIDGVETTIYGAEYTASYSTFA